MCKLWNKIEVEFLKKNYPHLILSEIAKQLNRTYKSVYHKAKQLSLIKQYSQLKSDSLKKYYKLHPHHTKGKPKSEEQKEKMSIARKKWYKKQGGFPEETKKKISKTKIVNGDSLGAKNPMFGKKRLDLSKRNIESWKDINFRKKIRKILSKTTYRGSKRQKQLYKFLCKFFNKTNIKFNDWKLLDHKYEVDILICPLKIAIEWDGYHWHYELGNEYRDIKKNEALIQKGWKFIRVTDSHLNKSEVLDKYDLILDIIGKYRNTNEFKYTGGFYI